MQRICIAIVLTTLLALLSTGCAMLAQPDWSENYALEGECDVEQLSDGSMYTTGETHMPEYIRGQRADDSRFSDAILTFKEPKTIKKIVIRRRPEDSVAVDINVLAMINGDWKMVKQARGEIKDDINIMVSTTTDKLKIRAQRATRTAKGKSGIARSAGGGSGRGRRTQVERVLREPLRFAEIEIYGLKPKEES